jgi:hypothetical protein
MFHNRFFFLGSVRASVVKKPPMSLSPTIIAVLASFAIVGCATHQPPPTPAQTNLEKKDMHKYNQEVEGRVQ